MIRKKWFALPMVLLAFAMFANASPIMNVYATLGPSALGASYGNFVNNVVSAMQSGTPLLSTGAGAATYSPISMIAPNQPIESNFPSWQGTTPGLYAGEVGTDLYFVLHIKDAAGATFSLSQLSWLGTSPNAPNDSYSYGSPNNDTYDNHRRGYVGGVCTDCSGQPGTTPVDELIYVGVSNFYPVSSYTGNNQADLNVIRDGLAAFAAGQYITGTYTLVFDNGASISNSAAVQFEGGGGIPEPGTIALAATGLAAMLFVRRKRSQRTLV